ncbi:ABC-2 family transporter protein [Candidatus Gottesmanbacteria bacterium]|nr:ABC-2 family transporter protein [Candidatus Gottesmanbacteria bacterium]
MRYIRIFLLFFEHVYQYRSRIFVWFLVSLFHPLIYLLFWSGRGINTTGIITYYLFYIIAGGFFVHVEADARPDILEGQLTMYLIKPFSYLQLKFFSELPWRMIQGSMGFIVLSLIAFVLAVPIQIVGLPTDMLLAIVIAVFGYCVMFMFKMIILLTAFWTTDISGFQQLSEMILIVCAGFIMPIYALSDPVRQIIYLTPFPYMIYFPVMAFMGKLSLSDNWSILAVQVIWLVLFYGLYKVLWHHGIRKFSAVGI